MVVVAVVVVKQGLVHSYTNRYVVIFVTRE